MDKKQLEHLSCEERLRAAPANPGGGSEESLHCVKILEERVQRG